MAQQLHLDKRLGGLHSRPPNFTVISYRWLLIQLYYWLDKAGGCATWMRKSSTFRFGIEVATVIGVFITLIAFWSDRDARKETRAHQAWSLVATGHMGNIGLVKALQFLHGEGIVLSSIKLSKAHLYGVKLPGANLNHANFEDAELSTSMLAGASLRSAKLSLARLREADLADADMSQADLTRANLDGANLNGTSFDNAILAGAKLRSVTLNEDQMSEAWLCGTILPDERSSDRDCAKLQEECEALRKKTAQDDRLRASCEWLGNRNGLRIAYGEW